MKPKTFSEPVLPVDNAARKGIPLYHLFETYPLALAAVARAAQRGADRYCSGRLEWRRELSPEHADCILRHMCDLHTADRVSGEYRDAVAILHRALMLVQELEEYRLAAPPSRGSVGGEPVRHETIRPPEPAPEPEPEPEKPWRRRVDRFCVGQLVRHCGHQARIREFPDFMTADIVFGSGDVARVSISDLSQDDSGGPRT